MLPLAEFATPKVERQRGQVVIFSRQTAIAQLICHCFVGTAFQPIKGFNNHFFGVTMKFRNKRRQKGERVTAKGTKKPPDRQRVSLGQGD